MSASIGIPPAVSEEDEYFWQAAAEGRLVVERCRACGTDSLPPRGICPACRGRDMYWVDVTTPGVIYSYTVNYQRWLPDLEVPYAIGLVEFPAHPGVRIMGRLRGVDPDRIEIGATVAVGFEEGPGGFAVASFEVRPADG